MTDDRKADEFEEADLEGEENAGVVMTPQEKSAKSKDGPYSQSGRKGG